MDALVRLDHVSKSYGGSAALKPTSIEIARGRTTVLIGPSGCGKSTLLRIVIGLIQPDTGKVEFDGQAVREGDWSRVRRRTGYVIQEGGLFPHLTARENIELMAKHWEEPPQAREKRLQELCQLTRLPDESLHRYPVELSGGQRQRVGVMRALMLSPELLLLDEPLGALDPLVRAALQKDLKEIFERLQQTALLVTHDLAEAAYVGHTIVLMNNGEVVQQGTIRDLRENPAMPFVTEFINAQKTLVKI
jgi:osmoprotectant transport system ATP-binding protein